MRNVIAGVVTLVWALNIVGSLIFHEYKPDPNINAIFMAVVGGLFASSIRDKKDKATDDDQEKRTTDSHRKQNGGGAHRE